MAKDKYLRCLLQLFRDYGYDGATLAKISQATGLGKASLYHHFPQGKEEMVRAVLEYLEEWFQENILGALHSQGSSYERLERMAESISQVYEGGKQPCLFAILLMGSARDVFHEPIKGLLRLWIKELAQVLEASGLEERLACHRAEDGVLQIQGALILAQGLDDVAPFVRVLKELPSKLLGLSN